MPARDRLIETTVLVDLLRGEAVTIAWINSLPPGGRCVSVISYFELLAGCRDRHEQRRLGREMRNYRLLLLNESVSGLALKWFERYRLSHGIGFLDSLIGATASHHHLQLATLNAKHFAPFPGVRVEKPY